MELELERKKALITGASHGIGKAIKEALENEGVEVYDFSRTTKVDLMSDEGMEFAIRNMDKFDILINNVGGCGTCTYPDWRIAMEKNYGITNQLTMRYLSSRRKWGRVITITSIYGTYPGDNPWFSSAKAAQIMLMKSLARKHKGITLNCVSPSEVADAGNPKDVKLKAKDIANLVVFLCSDKAKFINGQNIIVGEYGKKKD